MHRAAPDFWVYFDRLPSAAQRTARRNFNLLKENPGHPSLRFKKVGSFWSARVGRSYRALAVEDGADFIWLWVGTHADYDRMIGQ